ncbi:sugar-phosphatase [Thermomonospora echinospora]|uniref:Sugar-phosphatase n=1 Tax=Thermomonospora echinospora TaxID=1992 RepID=A0A1H5W854_9ACTN|nr:HAD family phosphatase [Thermomonospora echinospora]SEF95655.1 sugar-phosphatase [Thermomonospora echinospora]
MALTRPAAAIFDLDGTLIHTEPRNRVLWTRLFERHGVAHDEALIASFAGRRGHEVLAELLHLFPGRTVEELFRQAIEYEEHPDWPDAEPVPGAVELVHSLHAEGVPLGLVTSGMRPYAHGLLEELGITRLLDVIVTADDVRNGKPHPEGYLAACAHLAVSPARAVAFEDAPAGVAAAKAAGMAVVAVATTMPAARLSQADRIVADLREVRWPRVFGG